jgi:Cytochrome c554 and c-prime
MARAATRASDSEQLKSHPELSFTLSQYKYELVTKNGQSLLSVTNGVDSTTKKLEWALGDGFFGQSYVYRENGKYYEAQLSFYTEMEALDITTGHSRAAPPDFESAAGGYTPPDSITQCFGCHSTASTANDRFDPDKSILGVTCEACHGPGVEHAALMASGVADAKGTIMDLASLNPVDSVDFCGACHRTYADVVLTGFSTKGIINVRLQAYRLEKSKCWGNGDRRLTCVACHDPHVQVVRDSAFYDAKCLKCHRQSPNAKPSASHPGAACRVSTKNCVTCHMPKIKVPGTHGIFTDHWIRIAHPGAPYPS